MLREDPGRAAQQRAPWAQERRVESTLADTIGHETRSAEQSGSGSSGSITGFGKAECPICGGIGWLRVERELSDPRFGKLEACECQEDRALARLRGLSGLHGAELRVRLADIKCRPGSGTAQMVQACEEFMARPQGFLTIWGSVGTGKTSCLYAVTNGLMRGGAVYVSLHDLLEFVRDGFERKTDGDDAHARLKRFMAVPVLCLDEIDKVKGSEWVTEQLTALVDARYRSAVIGESGTVLALNSDPAGLPGWIASRLRDGRCRVVHNADRDAREFMQLTISD